MTKVRFMASLVLVATFTAPFSVATAASQAVGVGLPCKKVSAAATYKYTKYVCVKTGKRLVWRLQPINVVPTPVDPRAEILFSALRKLRDFNQLATSQLPTTYERLDQGFSSATKLRAEEGHRWALAKFGKVWADGVPLGIVYANSANFAIASLKDLGATQEWLDEWIGGFISNAYAPPKLTRPVWAPAALLNGDRDKPVIVYLSYPSFNPRLDTWEIGPHEIFHYIQGRLNKDTFGSVPCWIIEGQASLIGTTFASVGRTNAEVVAVVKSFGPAHSAGADLTKLEWNCGDTGEYQQGRIATALLVHTYGAEKMFEFLSQPYGPRDTSSWKKAFEQVYGVSVESFYSDAERYLKWFFKNYFNQDI